MSNDSSLPRTGSRLQVSLYFLGGTGQRGAYILSQEATGQEVAMSDCGKVHRHMGRREPK